LLWDSRYTRQTISRQSTLKSEKNRRHEERD
jgi:hypothetical protein